MLRPQFRLDQPAMILGKVRASAVDAPEIRDSQVVSAERRGIRIQEPIEALADDTSLGPSCRLANAVSRLANRG